MLTEKLFIKKEELEKLERILAIDEFDDSFEQTDQTLAHYHHYFKDGINVVISVCTGQHNAWVDTLWYGTDGELLSTGEPSFELEGEAVLFNASNEISHSLMITSE